MSKQTQKSLEKEVLGSCTYQAVAFLNLAWYYSTMDYKEMNTGMKFTVGLTERLLKKDMPALLEMCLAFVLERQFVIFFLMKNADKFAKDSE